jgi:hypothetical protein
VFGLLRVRLRVKLERQLLQHSCNSNTGANGGAGFKAIRLIWWHITSAHVLCVLCVTGNRQQLL